MNTEETREQAVQAWAAFSSADVSLLSELFHPDAEWIAPPDNATSRAMGNTGSRMVGRDRILHFLTVDYPKVFRDASMVPIAMFVDGDTAITEARLTATLAHGGHYANDYCFFIEFREGRIVQVREYMDTARGHLMFDHPQAAADG